MKIVCAIVVLIVVALFYVGCLFGCAKGCVPYEDGICTCDAPTETYKMAPTPTSDEKPPTDKMPSYQRAGVHPDMPSPVGIHDERAPVSDGVPMIPNDGVPNRANKN